MSLTEPELLGGDKVREGVKGIAPTATRQLELVYFHRELLLLNDGCRHSMGVFMHILFEVSN